MELYFITGNKEKLLHAQHALQGTYIELVQKNLNVPEIQSVDVDEIASFSAHWAAEKIKKPVVVTDAGYYISALNGFPGPFVKYINNWLKAEDILKIMEGKKDRSIIVRCCLAYCEPMQEPKIFKIQVKGMIANTPAKQSNTTEINRLFIPDGYTEVMGLWSLSKQQNYWIEKEVFWNKLVLYLQKNNL